MKAFLITSALTFVPDNYDGFILPLLESPHIAGLLIHDNHDPMFFAKGVALLATGAAPRFGWQLLRNHSRASKRRREQACQKHGKIFRQFRNLNENALAEWLREQKADLVLNARTRAIFKKNLLTAPRLGCLNIHHGLLPEQRGLMCDFWAHLLGGPSGFSVHVMTPRLDDGPIIKAVPVETDKKDYMQSLKTGAQLEAQTCLELLNEIAASGEIRGTPNHSEQTVYRRNPGLKDFYRLRWKGTKI